MTKELHYDKIWLKSNIDIQHHIEMKSTAILIKVQYKILQEFDL